MSHALYSLQVDLIRITTMLEANNGLMCDCCKREFPLFFGHVACEILGP